MSLLRRNAYQPDLELADHFSGTPSPTGWTKWFGGVMIPMAIAWYGIGCILAQDAILPGRGSIVHLTGRHAVVMGACWLTGGLFLHFHYFWSALKHLWVLANLGKIFSLMGFIGCLMYVVWSIISETA